MFFVIMACSDWEIWGIWYKWGKMVPKLETFKQIWVHTIAFGLYKGQGVQFANICGSFEFYGLMQYLGHA
jgi:hypothetical protein